MAAPVDAGRTTTSIATATAPWTVNLPASIAAGDLLIIFIRLHGAPTTLSATGWTNYINAEQSDASDDRHYVLTRTADGTEGATVSVAMTGGIAKGAAIAWRVTGADAANLSNVITTGGANLDCASVTSYDAAAHDALILLLGGVDGETQTFAHGTLVNDTNANSGTAGATSTNVRIGGATIEQTAISSYNPAAWTNAAPVTASGGTAIAIFIPAPAAGGTNHSLGPFNETITLSDAVVKSPKLSKADTATLSDAITRAWVAGRSFADTVTLSESIAKSIVKAQVDTVTLSDNIQVVKLLLLELADTITLSDAASKRPELGKADTVTLSDAAAKRSTLSKADQLTLTDAVAKRLIKTAADSLTLTDVLTKSLGLSKTDAITLTDAVGKAVGKSAGDTITLSDAFDADLTPGGGGPVNWTLDLSDTIALSDDIARALNGEFLGQEGGRRLGQILLSKFGFYE